MNRKANSMVVGSVLTVVVIGILVFLGSFLLRPAPSSKTDSTKTASIGDIDRSGTVDEFDKQLVKSNIDCLKTQPCWKTTIGKTKDGDNPLYIFDLDLNKDGAITQEDLDLVK